RSAGSLWRRPSGASIPGSDRPARPWPISCRHSLQASAFSRRRDGLASRPAVKVIFHADDFGLTRAVNAGIVEAHARGLLRSTSLMPSAAAAEDAAALARSVPDLDVGLHVTLVEERPLLPADRLPGPVAGGRFWARDGTGVAALAGRRVPPADRDAIRPFVTIGFLEAGGRLTPARLLAGLDHLRARGVELVEVMLHPGHRDAETERKYGHWGYRWDSDRELLLDPTLPEALARRGIEPTSFRALAAHAGAL